MRNHILFPQSFLLFLTVIAGVSCEQADTSLTPLLPEQLTNTADQPALGTHGMVSSGHPLATQAGLEIFAAGGNAFDAAIAVAAALNVTEPMMSGIGGYGTVIVYDARRGRARFLNCSSRIPAAVDSDVYRPPTPNYRQNRRNAKAVSTPGNVHAWQLMHQDYGKLSWDKLFQPAIELAEQGFILRARTANSIGSAFRSFPEHAQDIYGPSGAPLKGGERLIQKELGHSFRLIAQQGAEVVYNGSIAQAIDQAMRQAEGFLSIDDLRKDKAEWFEPISINYRDCQVITASPPSTAFPSLIRLGMMSRFDPSELGHNTTEYLHRFAEVTKHAFWCRLAYAGGPDLSPPPLNRLLSEEYWKQQVGQIDLNQAKPFEYPGIISEPSPHTTHFVVADKFGNIVCATQTLGNAFGSRIMPEGTGIWLNNSLAYCTFEPKGNPMDAHAGHYKLSGDCPTLIIRNGRPWVAIGTPGGHTIGQTVPQMLMNLIDFNMNIQQAIAAGRISFVEPDTLSIERTIPEMVRQQLAQRGHKIRTGGSLGCAHGLTIEYDQQGLPIRFTGGADPRGQGLAKGY